MSPSFCDEVRSGDEILSAVWELVKVSLKSQQNLCKVGAKPVYVQRLVGWVSPEVGWVKFNVDGACKEMGRAAGCGGVMSRAPGFWDSANGLGHVTLLKLSCGAFCLGWRLLGMLASRRCAWRWTLRRWLISLPKGLVISLFQMSCCLRLGNC